MSERNENRPGYKKTKVGWIPQEWGIVKLDDLVQEKRLGANYANGESEQGLPLVKMGNIGRGRIKLDKVERIPSSLVYDKTYLLQNGDILFNTRNTLDLVGKVAIWNDELPLALYNSNLLKLKFKGSKVGSPFFANYLLNSQESLRQLRGMAIGTTSVAAIYDRDLVQLKAPLPALPEQKKIAEILSTWDKAIDQTRRLIDAKKRLKKALMQQLLTGNKRAREFERDEWFELPLGKFVTPVSRPVPKPNKPYLAIGLRSHGKGTFHRFVEEPEKVAMETLYRLEPDDIVVNITFAWEGAIAIAKAQDLGGLVSHRFPTYRIKNTADLGFFRQLIMSKRFVWDLGLISPGGAGRNRVMSQRDFLKLRVWVPSKRLQEKIGEILLTADNEIVILEKKLIALEKQKRGLMQKLLTGEVRVKT